jgi:hypothetical protein
MNSNPIDFALRSGIRSLGLAQSENGGFLSLSAANKEFINPRVYKTTFFTSQILSCLNRVDGEEALTIKQQCANFLLGQKSQYWSFNYWQKDSVEYKDKPYPDDLDDTFCALAALSDWNPSIINGEALARVVDILTQTEQKPGGPYKTWLVSSDAAEAWQDIDTAVNANIAYFLSKQKVSVPGLNEFLGQKIFQRDYKSPYYPSVYPVIYFLSRSYSGDSAKLIKDFLFSLRGEDGIWENPLNTALALTSLINLGYAKEGLGSAINYLLQSQHPNGAWSAQPFCFDPSVEGKKYVAGSTALTTAFCMQALSAFCKASISEKESSQALNEVYQQIIGQAQQRIAQLDPNLKPIAEKVLQKTLSKDLTNSIALLPQQFKQALGASGGSVADSEIIQLGLANLYGWMAYTIYDDILDNTPNPQLLPWANVCLREVTRIYEAGTGEIPSIFHSVMDKLDAANTWEVCYTQLGQDQLPDYEDLSQLAEKSFGHALGPLRILNTLGYSQQSPEFQGVKNFFLHYLIARQLNDDAHDWQEDLNRGQINAVGAMALRQWQEDNIGEKVTAANVAAAIPGLQKLFWEQIIFQACDLITEHLNQAKQSLAGVTIIEQPAILLDLLKPLEKAVEQARSETKRTKEFLEAYT